MSDSSSTDEPADRLQETTGPERARAIELAERALLCCAGIAAEVVIHELTNLLNAILLKMAVLQQKAPEGLRDELGVIRDQGRLATDLLMRFQHFRQDCRPAPYPVSVNDAVRAAAGPMSPNKAVLRLDLAPDLPPILGNISDVKTLVSLLLDNAVAVTSVGGEIGLRTSGNAQIVVLQVEDGGPQMPNAALANLFSPTVPGREGSASLNLAGCQTLTRRLQGTIRAANRSQGGMLFSVEFKAASAEQLESK